MTRQQHNDANPTGPEPVVRLTVDYTDQPQEVITLDGFDAVEWRAEMERYTRDSNVRRVHAEEVHADHMTFTLAETMQTPPTAAERIRQARGAAAEQEEGWFTVTDLEAVQPEGLPFGRGVEVTVHADVRQTSSGACVVDLGCADRLQLIAYVRDNWGDDDREWFADYVVARIDRDVYVPRG